MKPAASFTPGRVARAVRRRSIGSARTAEELVHRRMVTEPQLLPLFESFTDEEARLHFGAGEVLEDEWLRTAVRFFHAWRVDRLRRLIGGRLPEATILDVGDSDGRILKSLGKTGTGVNLSEQVVENIRANGVEAVVADAHGLPFPAAHADYVLCFETLEHVESPIQLLDELARVCRPGGAVFVSIPWVPRTFVHARQPGTARGREHIFEFDRRDFERILSHTSLEIAVEEVFDLFGSPASLQRFLFLASWRGKHIVADSFRRFAFFQLKHRTATA